VQHEGEKIELQNAMETLGKLVKEASEVAMLCNSFADFEKGFELPPGVLEGGRSRGDGRDFLRILHEFENSTRFGEVTTAAEACQKEGDLRILWAQWAAN